MAEDLVYLTRLPEAEREQFRIAMNLLFTEGFLVRSIEQHERSYRFVLANLDLCESYLGCAGWGLRRDESLGVIAFNGPADPVDESSIGAPRLLLGVLTFGLGLLCFMLVPIQIQG